MLSVSTIRIAWRNLWRNRRRTVLALSAIGLSVALVLVYDGVLRGYGDWMTDTITGPMLGHVQAHAPEWRRTRAMERTLRGVSRSVDALRRDPAVAGANARIYAPALAARGEEGFAVVVLGVEVAGESRRMGLLAGEPRALTGHHVLMGRLLAQEMNVHEGDVVAIVGQGADGSLANDLFTVVDLVETPVDFVNRQGVVMPIDEAQALFAMPDEAHEVVIYARDPARAGELAARLGGIAEMDGAEVLDWQTLAPGMVSLLRLVEVSWVFILV